MPSKTKIETFRLASLPEEVPFSSAVRVKDKVTVSGQVGHRPGEMRLVDGGFTVEAEQALAYMREALKLVGSSLDRVIKCTVFFPDIKDFRYFSGIYRRYFSNHLPARSGVEAQGLTLGARIEIECIALVD